MSWRARNFLARGGSHTLYKAASSLDPNKISVSYTSANPAFGRFRQNEAQTCGSIRSVFGQRRSARVLYNGLANPPVPRSKPGHYTSYVGIPYSIGVREWSRLARIETVGGVSFGAQT